MARERERRRAFPLQIESLEGKLLLSTAHPAAAPPLVPPTVHGQPLSLAGTLTASAYKVLPVVTANDQPVKISLLGTVGSLGQVSGTMTEQIDQSVEVVARGTLILQNAKGSIALNFSHGVLMQNLTEPYNEGFVVEYRIAGGTGAYAGATGSGVLDVAPDIGDFDLRAAIS
jgi:hypothetical protein